MPKVKVCLMQESAPAPKRGRSAKTALETLLCHCLLYPVMFMFQMSNGLVLFWNAQRKNLHGPSVVVKIGMATWSFPHISSCSSNVCSTLLEGICHCFPNGKVLDSQKDNVMIFSQHRNYINYIYIYYINGLALFEISFF